MLTKGQLQFMMKEIELQNKGFGFKPRYNNALSNEENMKAYKKLYTDYWNNIPGEPVKNRQNENITLYIDSFVQYFLLFIIPCAE